MSLWWRAPVAVALAILHACHGATSQNVTLSRAELLDPATCAGCHPQHYADWSVSVHATAADDPVFVAMNQRAQRETHGAIGTFCVQCHAPLAVSEGLTTDGLNLADIPSTYKGVTCYTCHNVDSVGASHNNGLKLANDTTMRGAISNPVANQAHHSAYSPLMDRDQTASASVCGSCHDIVTPAGDKLEATYQQWQASVFSQAGIGQTCSQCHMNQSIDLQPIAEGVGMPARRTHEHRFVGVDLSQSPNAQAQAMATSGVQDFLNTALQSALCVKTVNGAASLRVVLDNVAAGHAFPTGAAQDRRIWVELVAYKGNQIIYQTGVVTDANNPNATTDPDLWMLRTCASDANGQVTPMFWQAASHTSNTLPALATFNPADARFYQTHVVQIFPRDPTTSLSAVPDKVTLRVLATPIGFDLLDDLIASGDLDANFRQHMHTFDVGTVGQITWTAATVNGTYEEDGVPVNCVTNNGLNIVADKVPAASGGACGR